MFLWGVPRLSSEYLYMYFFFCSDDTYLVVDYCPRNLVQMSELENSEGILPGGKVIPDVNNFLAWLTLLQNNENKTIEWLVAFNSECERRRWFEAVTPQISDNPEEKIYEEWDCPLVEAVVPFQAHESDELALDVGEKANVLRKLSDSGKLWTDIPYTDRIELVQLPLVLLYLTVKSK